MNIQNYWLRCLIPFLFLLIKNHVLLAQLPQVVSGSIIRWERFPSSFVHPRNIDIWLPDHYSTSKKYAVLYMHDGQMLFDSAQTWNRQEWNVDGTAGRLMAEGNIKDCIVVGIWNNGIYRHAEYAPQKAIENLPDSIKKKLRKQSDKDFMSDQYLKFMVHELKPAIDSAFSTKKSRMNTFISGSSMGGLISLYAICEYPEVFGGAACLSTHWTGIYRTENNPFPAAILSYLDEHLPTPARHKMYFDHGTTSLDSLYTSFQKQADEIMKQHGYPPRHWQTRIFEGADHSENAWRNRLEIPLLFLLQR